MVRSLAYFNALFITGYIPTQQDYVDYQDTMTNLDVILGASGSVGGKDITSIDGDAKLTLLNTLAKLGYTKTSTGLGGSIDFYETFCQIIHDGQFIINVPQIFLIAQANGKNNTLNIDVSGQLFLEEKPLIYRAIISQSGIDAPVVNRLTADTIGGVTFGYNSVGYFQIVPNVLGSFTIGKTIVKFSNNFAQYNTLAVVASADMTLDLIEFKTFDETFTPTNNGLLYTEIEILVYP